MVSLETQHYPKTKLSLLKSNQINLEFKNKLEHFRGSTEVPSQNLKKIGQTNKQINKHTNKPRLLLYIYDYYQHCVDFPSLLFMIRNDTTDKVWIGVPRT